MAIETIAANKTGAPALEAAYAKIAWHLLPFLAVLWIIAWIDRVNIGFAKLEMLDNLKFSEVAYGFGAGIFFLGYLLFGVPSNLPLTRIGARRTIARITIGWGVTSKFDDGGEDDDCVLRLEVPARRVRSRLLSRRHSLSHLLVSDLPAGAALRAFHVRVGFRRRHAQLFARELDLYWDSELEE